MITLKDVANFIEDGINANLNYPNVVARVWAGVGRRLNPVRQGNTVTYFLTGSLRRPGSSDSALRIEAGTNNLLLELEVPQKPPKTEATQTEPELRETIDDQYVFPQLVAEAVNTFFQSVRTVTMVDGAGKTFSLGFTTGLNITGDVGRRSPSGDYVMIEVYIEMAYVEGGVNSRVSTLAIDSEDNFIPYQTKTVTRAPTEQPDVYAGGTAKQTLDTSATFGISFAAPVTEDFDAFDGFLQDGKLNVAHFIIESDGTPHYHFMKVHSVQRDAANVQNLGMSVELVDAVLDIEFVDVPDSYQVGRFEFSSSNDYTLTFTPSASGLLAWRGGVVPVTAGESVSLALTARDFSYDDAKDGYFVYVVTNVAMSVTGADMAVIKEAG